MSSAGTILPGRLRPRVPIPDATTFGPPGPTRDRADRADASGREEALARPAHGGGEPDDPTVAGQVDHTLLAEALGQRRPQGLEVVDEAELNTHPDLVAHQIGHTEQHGGLVDGAVGHQHLAQHPGGPDRVGGIASAECGVCGGQEEGDAQIVVALGPRGPRPARPEPC